MKFNKIFLSDITFNSKIVPDRVLLACADLSVEAPFDAPGRAHMFIPTQRTRNTSAPQQTTIAGGGMYVCMYRRKYGHEFRHATQAEINQRKS